jgi:hypothetical protein
MTEWIRQVIDGMRCSWPAEADRVRQAAMLEWLLHGGLGY